VRGPIPAIVAPAPIDTETIADQIRAAQRAEIDADAAAHRHEQLGADARAARKASRIEIGKLLLKARGAWPERGPNAKGWGKFLSGLGLAESTARMYMDEARDPEVFAEKRREFSENSKSGEEPDPADLDRDRERPDDQTGPKIAPAPRGGDAAPPPPFRQLSEEDIVQALGRLDPDAKKRILGAGKVNALGGSGDAQRGKWCTPKALAEAVGAWDLDPFTNPRSHVAAAARCMLEDGGDGFGDGSGPGSYRVRSRDPEYADARTRVWLQPPYEIVLDVVDHYKHTRFCALLRWSPDVEWFARLWPYTRAVAFPIGERLEFEPPEGVPSSGPMPFPHALYYADPRDITDAVRATCIVFDVDDQLREVVARIWGAKILPVEDAKVGSDDDGGDDR
jgi:hypothetical protein